MATPPQIDVEALLVPIPDAGRSDRDRDPGRQAVHYEFRQVLQGGDETRQDPGQGESPMAIALDRLIELGQACLTDRAKDLVVASWMTETLTRKSGFAGLRDGLTLMRGLLAHCWEDCHPRLGSDGDTDQRAMSLASLASDRHLLLSLRRVNLADAEAGAKPFCYLDVLNGRPPGRGPAPTEAEVESGLIGEAIGRSSRRFYERLADDLREAAEADRALGQEVKRRFADDPPDLRPIGRALQDLQHLLDVILTLKRRQEPTPAPAAPPPEPGATPSAAPSPTPVATGPGGDARDTGRVLIEFLDRARELAEAGDLLKKNRERYGELKEEMNKLDAEYEAIAGKFVHDEVYELLRTRRPGGDAGASTGDRFE